MGKSRLVSTLPWKDSPSFFSVFLLWPLSLARSRKFPNLGVLSKKPLSLIVLGPVKREKMKQFWVGKQRHKRITEYSIQLGRKQTEAQTLGLVRRWCVGRERRVFRIVSYHFHFESSSIWVEWGGKFARLRLKQQIEMLLFHSFSVFALYSAGILNSVSLHNMVHLMNY